MKHYRCFPPNTSLPDFGSGVFFLKSTRNRNHSVWPPPPIKRAEGQRTSTNARQAKEEVCQDAFAIVDQRLFFKSSFYFPKGMRWSLGLERSDTRWFPGLARSPLIRRQPIVPAQYLHPQIDVN